MTENKPRAHSHKFPKINLMLCPFSQFNIHVFSIYIRYMDRRATDPWTQLSHYKHAKEMPQMKSLENFIVLSITGKAHLVSYGCMT